MYKEPVKNFNKIRGYIREFYINGFKSRQDYTIKSSRSYDNEKRRIESYMSDYIDYHITPSGKVPYLSIDTRITQHNPLYRVWKTKSFTDHDIILHFLILDLLHTPLSMSELMDKIDEKTNHIYLYDESTLRKKLKEYVREGVIITNKKGKKNFYQLSEDYIIPHDILDFFSEVSPCGVIGSYILDKQEKEESVFGFKHHYLTQVLESEVLYDLLNAIHEHKYVSLKTSRNRIKVLPLSIFISVQDGRQYLIAYMCQSKKMYSFEPPLSSRQVKKLKTCTNACHVVAGIFLCIMCHLIFLYCFVLRYWILNWILIAQCFTSYFIRCSHTKSSLISFMTVISYPFYYCLF